MKTLLKIKARLVDSEILMSKKGEPFTLNTWQSDTEKSYIKTFGDVPEHVEFEKDVILVFTPSWKNNQLYLKEVQSV